MSAVSSDDEIAKRANEYLARLAATAPNLPAPIATAQLGAPRPGDECDLTGELAMIREQCRYEQCVALGIDDPLDARSFMRPQTQEDRERFQRAYEARAEEIGHIAAASEIASKAMKAMRSIKLRVDLSGRPRQYREEERMRDARWTADEIRLDVRSKAIHVLERLHVPPKEIDQILRDWRVLHGIRECYALDEKHARDIWPGKAELIEIVSARRSAEPEPEPVPESTPPPPLPAPEPERPMRADLIEAAAVPPAPKKARGRGAVRGR